MVQKVSFDVGSSLPKGLCRQRPRSSTRRKPRCTARQPGAAACHTGFPHAAGGVTLPLKLNRPARYNEPTQSYRRQTAPHYYY